MQVEVNDVEAEIAWSRDAADRVQVRAVVVHEGAGLVEDAGDLLDPLVEQTERGRIGQHQPGGLGADLSAEVV